MAISVTPRTGPELSLAASQFGSLSVYGRKVLVDGHFQEVGPQHVASRLQHNCDCRDGNLHFIRCEIANQPPHEPPVVRLADNIVIRGPRASSGLIGWGWAAAVFFCSSAILSILEALAPTQPVESALAHETMKTWVWMNRNDGLRHPR